MKQSVFWKLRVALFFFISVIVHTSCLAAGVVPETSVILVREADGEGVMKVTNTDSTPVMLTTTIEDIPEDRRNLIQVSPPVARVEPGHTQLVRFILTAPGPLDEQCLKRVIFEGIQQSAPGHNQVSVTVRQNLPLLVLPQKLAEDHEPWKHLTWSLKGTQLELSNPSPYVVRLDQRAQLLPAQANVLLPKPYVLPGETVVAKLAEGAQPVDLTAQDHVRVFPATVYGYMVKEYDSVLNHVSGD